MLYLTMSSQGVISTKPKTHKPLPVYLVELTSQIRKSYVGSFPSRSHTEELGLLYTGRSIFPDRVLWHTKMQTKGNKAQVQPGRGHTYLSSGHMLSQWPDGKMAGTLCLCITDKHIIVNVIDTCEPWSRSCEGLKLLRFMYLQSS